MCQQKGESEPLIPLAKGKPLKSSPRMKVVTAVMFAASSLVVTLANKSILTTYQFPSFKAMALIQSLTTVLVLYALKKLGFVEFSDLKWGTFDQLFPLPLVHVGGMLLSLSGTKELSIPMNTTIRRFAVMTTMILEYYVLSVWPSRSVQLSVMVMVLGAVIAMAEPGPNVFGYACVLISDAFSSYGCVFTKDILERDTSMNKYGFLFFNSLFVLPLMLLLACIDDDLVLAYNFPMWHDPLFSLMFVVANTLGALLSFTAMLCTLHNSALTTTIVACLKNAFITYVGMYWGQDYLFSWQNFIGINISILGSLLYTYVVFGAIKEAPIENKPVAQIIVTIDQ